VSGVSFAPGWDRRDRLTLRFLDPALEVAYQADTAEAARRLLSWACLVNAPIWLVGALLAPVVLGVDPAPVWLACSAQIIILLSGALLALRHPRRRVIDDYGLVINLSAGIVLVVITAYVGLFDRFALPFLIFTALVAGSVQRLPFTLAMPGAVGLLIAFSIGVLTVGTAAAFQIFVLVSALGVALSGAYLVESREREIYAQRRRISDLHRQVDALFHRYLSPDVAEALLADPDRAELGGEVAEVTVLFADLTGFTSYSERVAPDVAVGMLNASFTAAVPVVLGEAGTIVQFAGDAMMAIWNAPVRQPDHALRAARAALAMQRATARLGEDPDRPRFRVGLNTGSALVGNIGSAELQSFTAIGDTANLAARLQTFAPPGSVVMGERTHELIADVADVRPLGSPELKGKAVPVVVFELLGLRDAAASSEPDPSVPST
jgi:class 3 adenylate cyclase